MSRVSQEELYNDKDVVTQILKLKDTVNDYAGGIIEDIDVSGNDLVIDWADGTNISLPLPDPVTGISSVTGSVAGGNLTITFYFTNGTTHSFTCPLSGMASEAYVDAGLATKADDSSVVKLTGAQIVDGVKTFSDSPVVPDSPATEHSAVAQTWAENVAYTDDTVNNILHKEGYEKISGSKELMIGSRLYYRLTWNYNEAVSENKTRELINILDPNGESVAIVNAVRTTDQKNHITVWMRNTDGTWNFNALDIVSNN